MNREELSNFAEVVHNGGPIDWEYWASLQNITPVQSARLAFHIDPIKWPGMDYKQGPLPEDLLKKIAMLEQLLRNRWAEWNLNDLVIYLGENEEAIAICGEDFTPYGMVEQFRKRQRELSAAQERMQEQLRELELEDSIKRGRYTIESAALFISRNSRSNFEDMKNELKKSVENGELKFYDTDMDTDFKPTRVREFLGEVFWDEVNDWLEKKYPRLGRLFSKPDELAGQGKAGIGSGPIKDESTPNRATAKGRRDEQINLICKAAKSMNYDLLAIPEGGKRAIKAKCLENPNLFTDSGFGHAWGEANKRKVIRMQDKEKYLSNQ